jgi:hypothetical protein
MQKVTSSEAHCDQIALPLYSRGLIIPRAIRRGAPEQARCLRESYSPSSLSPGCPCGRGPSGQL